MKGPDDNLVKIKKGQPTTTSLQVAEVFGKQHKDVLRAIERLDCSEEFGRRNFAPSSYLNEQGKTQPMFTMTKDGFTFLAMGFTGKKSAVFKERYISAFNDMEQILLRQKNLSFQQERLEGKRVRKELTDVVDRFVDYATASGSKNARMYFMNITSMTYKALGMIKQAGPQDFRDTLDLMEISSLKMAEFVCQYALVDGMEQGVHYKDIYVLARQRVEAYAATIPTRRVLLPEPV
jgi:Rha family phage regulatory protein